MPIGRLVTFIKDSISPQAEEDSSDKHENGIRLATAAVLLEIANADSVVSEEEEAQIVGHLEKAFDLEQVAVKELLEAANEIRERSIDHWHLTHMIRKYTTVEERKEICRTMWRIVFADGYFHQYEGYLVRKLSDLLGLEHRVMIELKLEVKGGTK